jgi:hypothetical protein
MKLNTFGTSPAAQTLYHLLEDQPIARRKISTILNSYTNQLLLITQIKDPKTVRICLALLRDYTLDRLSKRRGIETDIKTYTENLIVARYRSFSKGFDSVDAMRTTSFKKKN